MVAFSSSSALITKKFGKYDVCIKVYYICLDIITML